MCVSPCACCPQGSLLITSGFALYLGNVFPVAMDYLRCAAGAVSNRRDRCYNYYGSDWMVMTNSHRLHLWLISPPAPQGFPAAIASLAIAKNRDVAVSGLLIGQELLSDNEQTDGIMAVSAFQGVGFPGGLRVHICCDDNLPGLVRMQTDSEPFCRQRKSFFAAVADFPDFVAHMCVCCCTPPPARFVFRSILTSS